MKTIATLTAERTAKLDEAGKILDAEGALTAEQRQRVEALHAEVAQLDKAIELRQRQADASPADANDLESRGWSDDDLRRPYDAIARCRPAWEAEYRSFDFSGLGGKNRTPESDVEAHRFLRALITNDQAELRAIAARQPAEHRARELRDATSTTYAGALPAGFHAAVQEVVQETSRMRNLANRIPDDGRQAVKVPVETQAFAAAVHAEGGDLTSGVTEQTIGSVTLTADQKLGGMQSITNELLDDSPINVVNQIVRSAGESIGNLIDAEAINGSAFTGDLAGLTAVVAVPWDDNGESLAGISEKLFTLTPISLIRRASWLINVAAAEYFSSLTATDGRPLFVPFGPAPQPVGDQVGQATLMGLPVYVFDTAVVPADTAFFGDIKGYALYLRGNVRAEVSREFAFGTDKTAVRILQRVDGVVSQASRILKFETP